MLVQRLLEAAATARLAEVMDSDAPRPAGPAEALSGRDGASRILLLGGGITSGWGVRSHGLALVGALQRGMQRRLGQDVDVVTVSRFGIEVAGAVGLLREQPREDIDAIVVAFGASDALRYTPTRIWRQEMERLLIELDARSDGGPSIPVVVAGIPPLDSLSAFTSAITPLLRRHAEHLNVVTQQVIARNRRAVFAPLPAMAVAEMRPYGSPAAYETWAEAIAAPLADRMPRGVQRIGDPSQHRGSIPSDVAAILAPTGQPLREHLQFVAAALQESLGADFAAVTLCDGDRSWTVADSAGTDARSAPLQSTYCAVTLREGYLHVADGASDERFASSDLVRSYNLWSYVGIAVRDAEGTPIGTVCAFNGAVSSDVDAVALRSAADRVEAALASLEAPPGRYPVLGRATSVEQLGPPVLPTASSPEALDRSDLRRAVSGVGVALTAWMRLAAQGVGLTRAAEARSAPMERPFEIAGPRPVRLLLVGGEYAVGFGAGTRADAVDGALARLLHARTGRGVVVENRARHLVRPRELAESLGPLTTSDFDLVVWAPTFVEASRVLAARSWPRGIRQMLRTVAGSTDASVVLLGLPPLLGAQPLAVAARARAARLNRVLRRVAAQHPGVLAVEPPPVRLADVDGADGAEIYRDVAVRLLPSVLELLEGATPRVDASTADGRPLALLPA